GAAFAGPEAGDCAAPAAAGARRGNVKRSPPALGTLIHTTRAVAPTASGPSQVNGDDPPPTPLGPRGLLCTLPATSAWQRAQSAACNSTVVRSRALSVPSDHAASVSVSRHDVAGPGVIAPRSVSRSSRGGTSFIDDLFQIQRAGIVGHRREARGDLI